MAYDNRMDRPEVWGLIKRLGPVKRLAFQKWACRVAYLPASFEKPEVKRSTVELARLARWDDSADLRHTWDAYMDLFQLANEYAFSLDDAVAKLVEMVRGKGGGG